MTTGFTLLETIVVLALLYVGLAITTPLYRRQVDRFAVAGAREAMVGLVTRARTDARDEGGASVVLDRESDVVWILIEDDTRQRIDLQSAFGVDLAFPGARSVAELRYDGLGIGRFANRTVSLERGGAIAKLVVSSYGRVRRE